MPISASRTHSQSNIGMSPEQASTRSPRSPNFAPATPDLHLEVGVSTAFGCTMEGPVDEDWVIELAVTAARNGADSVGLSDTTGYAEPGTDPAAVHPITRRAR